MARRVSRVSTGEEEVELNMTPMLDVVFMLVAVTGNNEIWVNRRSYEMAELRGVIEQLLQENPKGKAMIQGDEGANIGTILDVQELLTEMGVEVHISTLQN